MKAPLSRQYDLDTALPRESPRLSVSDASRLLAEHWHVTGELTELGSLQDQNFCVKVGGEARYVLKAANRKWPLATLEMQNAALAHVKSRLSVGLSEVVATASGATIVDDGGHRVRLLTWVPGHPLASVAHLDNRIFQEIGRIAGRCTAALRDFDHPAVERIFQWDTRFAPDIVMNLADSCSPAERELLSSALAPLAEIPHNRLQRLPLSVIHADVNDHNVLATVGPDGGRTVTGLLDFGDVVRTWRICDPAAAAVAAIARDPDSPLEAALAILAGFHAVEPLNETEAGAFWPVVLARAALCVATNVNQLRMHPDSSYVQGALLDDRTTLACALSVDPQTAAAAARAVCGFEPVPGSDRALRLITEADKSPLLDGSRPTQLVAVDMSAQSELFRDGNWRTRQGIAEAIATVNGTTVSRWAEARLHTPSGPELHREPSTLQLGTDVFADLGSTVRSPLSGTVHATDSDAVVLLIDIPTETPVYLKMSGIAPRIDKTGAHVTRGAEIGHIKDVPDELLPPHVHIQLSFTPCPANSARVSDQYFWLAICPDPSAVLQTNVAAHSQHDPTHEKQRRTRYVAGAQRLYYHSAMELVRGWRQMLYDSHGRAYLDMVNNVAVVGHSHPRIVSAATRQLQLLNTNSRFLYPAMTDYAQRIVDTLPPTLNRVFLVNSGSEAMDLAVRLARTFTKRLDLIALEGAYHGWTSALMEAASQQQDNPTWRDTLPNYIHIVEAPDPFRGAHSTAEGYLAALQRGLDDAAGNGGPAAFLTEALLGNQGGIEPPRGYLSEAFDLVHAVGGLCIADEVQVGYGRTGETFWAFEYEHALPDIVATAKAAGNGHPIGVVACRQEVADAFNDHAAFFSSSGGGPVSCQIGMAVLDILEEEELQHNARVVGRYLKSQLERLATDYPVIGAIHGRGLYIGVDLVTDSISHTPASALAIEVCERMRDLGVITQPTGDWNSVLKVKPPLCVDISDADRFVFALRQALKEAPCSTRP
jgi:4-aminobutyrate aminotransferase-like enzyme/Ser/Thr protein kinase RdoA (MazF antagonist)